MLGGSGLATVPEDLVLEDPISADPVSGDSFPEESVSDADSGVVESVSLSVVVDEKPYVPIARFWYSLEGQVDMDNVVPKSISVQAGLQSHLRWFESNWTNTFSTHVESLLVDSRSQGFNCFLSSSVSR